MPNPLRPISASLLLATLPSADVLVVSSAPDPGVDFASIDDAITAATDGDVVLVRAGTYPGFLLSGKALTIAADAGADVRISGRIEVRNLLDPGASARLVGLRTIATDDWGLLARNGLGTLWVEECELAGAGGLFFGTFDEVHGFDGALVRNLPTVFTRCTLTGGSGADLEDEDFQFDSGDGGHGVAVEETLAIFRDCTLVGGDGGHTLDTTPVQGGLGGSGVSAAGATVHVAGCVLEGGRGGVGDGDLFACAPGGSGGDGVELVGAGASAWVLDNVYAPGSGGAGGAGCGPGPAGVDVSGAAVTTQSGTARSLAAGSPVREGEVLALTYRGEPGDLAFAILGADLTVVEGLAPLLGAALLPTPPWTFLPIGIADSAGEAAVGVPFPGFTNPAVEGVALVAQALAATPSADTALGSGATVLLLDTTF